MEKIIVTVSRNFKIISRIIFIPVFLYIPVQYKLYKIQTKQITRSDNKQQQITSPLSHTRNPRPGDTGDNNPQQW